MQQLAGLFPGSYYNSDESKALDFMGYFAHQRQQDEAFQNQAINREGALEDLFQTRQMNPLRVDNQRLMNDTLEAQLGGHRARSKDAELKLDTDTQLQPHVIKQKMQEALAGLTAAELKDEMAQINKMLINPHLTPGQRKVFEMLRENFPENYKLNQTLDSKETVAAMPKPGRTSGTGGPKAPADRFALITKIANPFDKYTAYVSYANELDDTDPNQARALAAAESIRAEAQTASNARVSSGKWEKGEDGKWVQSTAPAIQAPANAPAPKPAAPAAAKPMYAKNPQTGERIMSTDGGKTWNSAK